jgi:hypothetical protein
MRLLSSLQSSQTLLGTGIATEASPLLPTPPIQHHSHYRPRARPPWTAYIKAWFPYRIAHGLTVTHSRPRRADTPHHPSTVMASPPQRAYAPLQTSTISLPPNKRQRLSPGPSPLGTSYDGPYQQQQQQSYPFPNNGYNPVHQFNQPQPHTQLPPIDTGSRPAPGNMGPPERPKAEKATDINDLNDLVTAAGVDLRAEENYLAATYRNKHLDSSFSTSFGTSSSTTISPETSFQQWSQSSLGQHAAFQPQSQFSQQPVSQRSVEEEVKEKHRQAARRRAETKQAHLRNPFLHAEPVRAKLESIGYENQVQLNTRGVTEQQPPPVSATNLHGASMVGANGTGLVAASLYRTLEVDAPLADILALLSLACEQRMRSLAEDAYAISRSRQYGSHGVVPPEWSDVATGEGVPKETTARSQSITQTAWDNQPESAVSPMTVFPPKRELQLPMQHIIKILIYSQVIQMMTALAFLRRPQNPMRLFFQP